MEGLEVNDKPIQGRWIEEVPDDATEALLHSNVFLMASERNASWEPFLHLSE